MTTIFLIRHAEAEGNLYRRAQGQYDGLVTARGYEQIEALRRRFADVPVDAVYASDLFRTRMTAKAVCEPKSLPLHTDPALREFSIGQWEDMPWAEWRARDAAALRAFNDLEETFHPAGGETAAEVRRRITGAFWRIARENEGKTVAIVSHGMALRILLGTLEGKSFSEMRTAPHSDNTAVSCVEVEGDTARILYRDDNSHLGALSTFAKQSWWKREGGMPEPSLCYRSLCLPADAEIYLALRKCAWEERHEALDRFSPEAELEAARRLLAERADGVRLAFLREEAAGLIVPLGETCWFYLLPAFRNRRFGIQLLGEGVSLLRRWGRTEMQILCETEELAAYLAHYGFQRQGLFCRLAVQSGAAERR